MRSACEVSASSVLTNINAPRGCAPIQPSTARLVGHQIRCACASSAWLEAQRDPASTAQVDAAWWPLWNWLFRNFCPFVGFSLVSFCPQASSVSLNLAASKQLCVFVIWVAPALLLAPKHLDFCTRASVTELPMICASIKCIYLEFSKS